MLHNPNELLKDMLLMFKQYGITEDRIRKYADKHDCNYYEARELIYERLCEQFSLE